MEQGWNDFVKFKKFITPLVMPVIFWIGVAVAVILGIAEIVVGGRQADAILIIRGIFTLFVGPLFVRVFCEWVMTFFQEK
jgi:hypothetical protein